MARGDIKTRELEIGGGRGLAAVPTFVTVPMPVARLPPAIPDRIFKSSMADPSLNSGRVTASGTPIINISLQNDIPSSHINATVPADEALANELDYITVTAPINSSPNNLLSTVVRPDKASRILGIKHRQSMEPIPASARNSLVSTRSLRDPEPMPSFVPTLPLTSLYVVSGLPKSPHTWTLADPDAVLGLHHCEGAVSRWWRPEVLGSTVSPGAGGGKKKKRGKGEEVIKGAGALSKQEVGKMLSKALKVGFCQIVTILATNSYMLTAFFYSGSRSDCVNPPASFNYPYIHFYTPSSKHPPCPDAVRGPSSCFSPVQHRQQVFCGNFCLSIYGRSFCSAVLCLSGSSKPLRS